MAKAEIVQTVHSLHKIQPGSDDDGVQQNVPEFLKNFFRSRNPLFVAKKREGEVKPRPGIGSELDLVDPQN